MLMSCAETNEFECFRSSGSEKTEQDEEVRSKFELKARDADEPPSPIHTSDPAEATAKGGPFDDPSNARPQSREDEVRANLPAPQ